MAFIIGSVGMVLGALVAWKLVGSWMGTEGAKLASALCASYVGGSVNFAAVSTALQISPAAIPAAIMADNVVMAVALGAIMAVPAAHPSSQAQQGKELEQLGNGKSKNKDKVHEQIGQGAQKEQTRGKRKEQEGRGKQEVDLNLHFVTQLHSTFPLGNKVDNTFNCRHELMEAVVHWDFSHSTGEAHVHHRTDDNQTAPSDLLMRSSLNHSENCARNRELQLASQPAATATLVAGKDATVSSDGHMYMQPSSSLAPFRLPSSNMSGMQNRSYAERPDRTDANHGSNGSRNSGGNGCGSYSSSSSSSTQIIHDTNSSGNHTITNSSNSSNSSYNNIGSNGSYDSSRYSTRYMDNSNHNSSSSTDSSSSSNIGSSSTSSSDGNCNSMDGTAETKHVTPESLALGIAAAALCCAAGNIIVPWLGISSAFTLLSVAACSAVTAAVAAKRGGSQVFAGSTELGAVIMSIYFAVVGASAGRLQGLPSCTGLVAFMGIMIAVHGLFLWLVASVLLKMPTAAVLVGANACVGGPATAAGFAAARKWKDLVQPAMLMGSMGYAVGNAAGLMVAGMIGV